MARLSAEDQVDEKVANWFRAFNAVSEEIHTPGMRELLATLQGDELNRSLPLYIQLARVVNANNRAAATVAALLVATGIKPTAINYGDDE